MAKASSPKARPLAFNFVIWSGIDTAGLLYIMGFSASEIKRENPVKSENLPGCAVQVGSVAGIIGYNVSNRAFAVKLYFRRVHAFHTIKFSQEHRLSFITIS